MLMKKFDIPMNVVFSPCIFTILIKYCRKMSGYFRIFPTATDIRDCVYLLFMIYERVLSVMPSGWQLSVFALASCHRHVSRHSILVVRDFSSRSKKTIEKTNKRVERSVQTRNDSLLGSSYGNACLQIVVRPTDTVRSEPLWIGGKFGKTWKNRMETAVKQKRTTPCTRVLR